MRLKLSISWENAFDFVEFKGERKMNREEERMMRAVELIDVLLKIRDFTKEDWDNIIDAVADEFME